MKAIGTQASAGDRQRSALMHHAVAAVLALLFAFLTPGGFIFLWLESDHRTPVGIREALILAGGGLSALLASTFLRCRAGRGWFTLYVVVGAILCGFYFCGALVGLVFGTGGHSLLELSLLIFLPVMPWAAGVIAGSFVKV